MNVLFFRLSLRALICLLSLAASAASAATLQAEQLEQQVLQRNAGLTATRAAVREALARVRMVRALPDPSISAAVAPLSLGGFRESSGNRRNTNVRLEIGQELPWPGTLGLREDAARSEADAALQDVSSLRLQLAALSAAAYAEWYYVHRALQINQSNLLLVDELRQLAENRYATGLASQQDVLQAEVEMQHLRHRTITLQRQRVVVQARINGLLSRPADTALDAPAALTELSALPSYAALQIQALRDHPELKQLQKLIAANRARESLADKAFYPDFEIFGAYNSLMNSEEQRWLIGAGINLPIGRDKRRAVQDLAQATTARLQYQLEDRRAQLLSQLEQSRAAAAEAAHAVLLYQTQLIPRTGEALSAARAEYGSGAGAFSDVIQAERFKLQAELELERNRADYFAARGELRRWTGGTLPETTVVSEVQHETR